MNVHIRQAAISDLSIINQLVESAVMNWEISERVKRLSLSSYQYHDQDFSQMNFYLAEDDQLFVVGVYILSEADIKGGENSQPACLLHGIYVHPEFQRLGVGKMLFNDAEFRLNNSGGSYLLVKAQPGAIGFFKAQGMTERTIKNTSKDYPYFFQKKVNPHEK